MFPSSGGLSLLVPQVGAGGDWAGLLLTLAVSLQADLCVMTRLLGYVDPSDPCFVAAILTITFNPLFWNVVSTLRPYYLGQLHGRTDGWLFPPHVCLCQRGIVLSVSPSVSEPR